MNNRRAEYSLLIEEILTDDAVLRAQGLPGLSIDELIELRIMVQAVIERLEGEFIRRGMFGRLT